MMGQAQILAFSIGGFHFNVCPGRVVPAQETNYLMANGSMSKVLRLYSSQDQTSKSRNPPKYIILLEIPANVYMPGSVLLSHGETPHYHRR